MIIGTTPNLLDADLEGGKSFDKIVLKPCDWKELNTIIIKELNNYVWHDKKSETPIDDYNHLLDALGYAVWDYIGQPNQGTYFIY